jgi:hypothetical protein
MRLFRRWWFTLELRGHPTNRFALVAATTRLFECCLGVELMGPTKGHHQGKEPFRDQFVLSLKEVLQAFATTTPGYAHDQRSRWAYAFNPMADGDPEKPVYATMAALRAPNFAALRVGVTEGGQVVVEVEHRQLVTPYITNDISNPKEFAKIQNGLRQIIEHFERTAGIARHNLFDRFDYDPEYRQLAEQRLADARAS